MEDRPPGPGDDSEPDGADDPSTAEPGSSMGTSGRAGWQKVLGAVGILVVVVLVILLATGDHGPGRHAPSGADAEPIDGAPEMAVEGDDIHSPDWAH